jgi:hypothetical protein
MVDQGPSHEIDPDEIDHDVAISCGLQAVSKSLPSAPPGQVTDLMRSVMGVVD